MSKLLIWNDESNLSLQNSNRERSLSLFSYRTKVDLMNFSSKTPLTGEPSTESVNHLIDQALSDLKSNQSQSALTHLSQASDLAIPVRDLHYVRGICYLKLNRPSDAKSALEREVEHFPTNVAAQELLSEIVEEYRLAPTTLKPSLSGAKSEGTTSPLPIHFFTIVLNGQPFIRHHIEELQKLPCAWHWHIIEGVAELAHDTAWSVPNGGKIPAQWHRNGLSLDGTSEYIDALATQFPDKISVYRKPAGTTWDGKIEMVRAPLSKIGTECLLWQVDVDELWTANQIQEMRELFLKNPQRTAAFFHCYYFVGPRKYVSSDNTWATYPTDWLRVWRFSPGMTWERHEPPRLLDREGRDIGYRAPFTRDETRSAKITFQHFSYTTESQVKFKEDYYGYKGAVDAWRKLQSATGNVRPADYLPWAKPDAVVSDWDEQKGELLGAKFLSLATADSSDTPKAYAHMAVVGATQFETEVRKLFSQIRPTKIIETGTYFGQGTSSIIWRALKDLGITSPDFTTIEVNPTHWKQAVEHFHHNAMNVRAELGLSLPRDLLPSAEKIKKEFVDQKGPEGIYYDHPVEERATLYHNETNYDVPDNLLYYTMQRMKFSPDFVLLDSAGHVGQTEFEYFISICQSPTYIMLDDIYHCKHFNSLQIIKRDKRFSMIVESPEKFGFCIVRFTPTI